MERESEGGKGGECKRGGGCVWGVGGVDLSLVQRIPQPRGC